MEPLALLLLHLDEMLILNLLHPNISLQILHTVLYTFLKVLSRRICKQSRERERVIQVLMI